ncbi:MAG TPA: glycogen/starch/alpha-glucan phosphorylase, partial [Gemmataceae bacterium]|nr:glycogen/starch/alpha-glucan phosphorylase [Gemmataceae bacterium]
LLLCNPALAATVTDAIGDSWVTDLSQLARLRPRADDEGFGAAFRAAKRRAKAQFADWLKATSGVTVDPDTIFDCQVKRIHEYKRQLLNILHVIHVYLELVEDGKEPAAPRVVVFAGKAAPGYWAAKQIIRLINAVGREVNRDPRTKGLLKVAFLPDYRVTLAEVIIPAANLSEQISTAGTEASGTSCMKFAFNGALTIGTMDGANIEIHRDVGPENMFAFGLRTEEIHDLQRRKAYHPAEYYRDRPMIRRVLDTLKDDRFSTNQPGLFKWVFDSLTGEDRYFHLADLEDYAATQHRAATEYRDVNLWTRKAILNVARTPVFSSDRTIREYAEGIWNVKPVPPG